MNPFLTDGTLTEEAAGKDFVYILNDPDKIAPDEYNYISQDSKEPFIKTMYGNFNGQNAFYYVSNGHKSVASVVQAISGARFLEITRDFLKILITVKKSSFLKEENIVAALTKIFIDPKTRAIKAVYVPVIEKEPEDGGSYEKEVRSVFANLLKNLPNLKGDRQTEASEILSDESLTMEDVYDKISAIVEEEAEDASKSRVSIANIKDTGELSTLQPVMADIPGHTGYLAARNMPAITLTHLNGKLPEIVVTNDNFVIGRSSDASDGAVPDASASRIHCKISQVGNKIAVIDLGSANGTFVNGSRLKSGEARYISDNDTLRIGKCDFLIKFPKEFMLGDAAAKAQVREAIDKMSASNVLRSMAAAAPIAGTPEAAAVKNGGDRAVESKTGAGGEGASVPEKVSGSEGMAGQERASGSDGAAGSETASGNESDSSAVKPTVVINPAAVNDPKAVVSSAEVNSPAAVVSSAAVVSPVAVGKNKTAEDDSQMISAENPARLLAVYSASGGAGKTTVALAMSKILSDMGNRVLYICTSSYQTFGKLLGFQAKIEDDRIVEKKDFHQVRQYIKRMGFEFLQEVKRTSISAYAGITNRKYIDIIREAMVSDRYDIVIVDTESTVDDLNKWLIDKSDQLFIVTKQDERSYDATKQFKDLVSVIASNKTLYICNDHSELEHDAIRDEGGFGTLEVSARIEHFKNYDKLTIDDLAHAESLKNLAAKVIVK